MPEPLVAREGVRRPKISADARSALVHRGRRREQAARRGSVRPPRRLRARPAGDRATGVPGAAAAEAAPRHARAGAGRAGGSRAALPREAGHPPLPGLDGRAGARARRDRRRGVRRTRRAALDGGDGRSRPTPAHRGTARLRRDEDQEPRRRAREALRRRGRRGARPEPPDAWRRRLGAGARGLPDREAGAQERVDGVEVRTLSDGGQQAADVAHALASFLAAAERTLEVAIYDFQRPPDLDAIVGGALVAAAERGVAVRLAYNVDHPQHAPVPAPPRTEPGRVEALPFPTVPVPGVP